jgi:putative transposase
MSNYCRLRVPGATWFFTVNLADRGRTTLTDNIRILRAAYRVTVAEHPVFCDAMVVMPDHLHAVWTLPQGDADYSVRWRKIKGRFTHAVGRCGDRDPSKEYKRDGGVWQRRFWEHLVRDEDEYARAMRYVIGNPVKHGFVERAEDWPYSSVHRDRRAGRIDWAA